MKPLRKLAFFCAAASLAGLAACQQSPAPAPSETPATPETVTNGPDAKPGMSASDGRLVLPVIAGRPAAAYFRIRNDGDKSATLVSVYIAGAPKAEMHKTEGGKMSAVREIEIAPGQSVEFAPGGLHVMAFDVSDLVKAGGTAELTLTFSDGDKLSMPLAIETMGDAMGGMHH
ncbi:copper chaperone PCu(A)C [Novosphingobium mangrovi (ex Huang et al. 2023)]|uniref:Copper chaperone PCu(A)C n=1 Tax=Novosphingobium mangrovi (ex Huang et al. 2023) TaxID=2976432 RepID=A0ABT2IAL2_9SPHN|nr:copper chaperone PCu(A)C [Novosphingobium mangrovi (ex Huang et al. 2023)]MCT2401864.1 copper chaperone PCu(A)C [Novosphingobium mangrovi (ex Huang et al. 2023)]